MFVKICANTNVEDALLAAELGADAVGFVFAPSKRQVNAEQVAAIASQLSATVEKVGVFTETDNEEILRSVRTAGLSTVQLHSEFNPALIETLIVGSGGLLKILQVVDVPEGADAADLEALLTSILKHEHVFAALLDASHGGASGGTGKPFNWSATAAIVQRVQRETGGRVIIAGGLNPGNVAEAIMAFAPFGVDVASGVEASYGHKDPQKLKAFLAAAEGRTL